MTKMAEIGWNELASIFCFLCLIIFFLYDRLKRQRSEMAKSISDLIKQNKILDDYCHVLAEQKEELRQKNSELAKHIENANQELKELYDPIEYNETDISITEEFKRAVIQIKRGSRLIFIHGGAGTGKTTLIQWLKKNRLIHVVLAPTGLAALNAGGMTIHKFFGIKPVGIYHKDAKTKPFPRASDNVLQNATTICIDEISMVRADLLDFVDRSLRSYTGKSEPFGGYQMIFVGDLFQLPPVVPAVNRFFFDPSDPKYPGDYGWRSEWFLDADSLINQEIAKVNLTHVFRQNAAGVFAQILNELRCYKNVSHNLLSLNYGISVQTEAPEGSVIITGTNATAELHNRRCMNMLPSESVSFFALKTGVFCEYKESDLPANPEIILKNGAFVMLLYNDPDGQFVNGSTGRIIELTSDSVTVRLKRGNIVVISQYTWESFQTVWNEEQQRFENELNGTFSQIPLIPAYAITAHKSQGKTLDRIYVDIDRAFCAGQMYVALSRVREMGDIVMRKPIYESDIKHNRRLEQFLSTGKI